MARQVRRPLLTTEDRAHLRRLTEKAVRAREASGLNQAYAQGVADTLSWLTGQDMSPMLEEVTR